MYLFSRSLRLRPGSTRDAITWATEVTEVVNRISDVQVQLWSRVFSPGTGTLAWTTFVEDLGQLEAAQDKLMSDDGYIGTVDRGAAFVASAPDDSLATLVSGAPDPQRSIEYVTFVHSVCEPGALAKGFDLGVRLAERATAIGGNPCLFLADSTGSFGGVGWITGFADVAEMQRSEAAVMADPDFIGLVDESHGVYANGDQTTSFQHCYRQVR